MDNWLSSADYDTWRIEGERTVPWWLGAAEKTEAALDRHVMTCDGPDLIRGARMQRVWRCSCGEKFYGYDAPAKRWHKAHRAEVGG